MPTYRGGRHEHGQNFLIDRAVIATMTRLVADTDGPIIEIGPGRGALTRELHDLGRPLMAVEIDHASVRHLRERLPRTVRIEHADVLDRPLPADRRVVVGNLPFHLTTAILRKLLHEPTWQHAVLLVQWEVARRRAGVGGASMMTAQWWPWIEFDLHGRVPRTAFTPVPNVDGGIITMTRRSRPLVAVADGGRYRQLVHRVFTGRGRGIAAIVAIATGVRDRRVVNAWATRAGVATSALPKDLTADQWASLFHTARDAAGTGRGRTRSRGRRR